MKRPLLELIFTEAEIREMMETKRALDPKMILCRGNLFEEAAWNFASHFSVRGDLGNAWDFQHFL